MTLTATSPLKQTEPAQEAQEETPSAVRRPNRRAVMVSAVLTQLMIVLDLTIIAIALPHMQEDLGMTVSQSPWTVTGYSLAFGGLVLFGGRLCAVVGIRRSYQVGLIGFGIASLAAGLAPSFPVLVTARVAQGCFGALLAPTSQSLLNVTFTERAERERVFAIFGATGGLGAGGGPTPHAHATANVKHPVQQGMAAFIGIFIDTLMVCTATALIILLTDANLSGETGAAVTQLAFNKAFPGFGSQLLAVCLTFFAFTTIIGWYYFGESNIRFLFRGKHLGIYRALVLVAIVLGTLGKVDLVWSMSDMFNGFMVLPNLIALFLLRKEIRAVYDDYLAQTKAGKELTYNYEFHEFHDKNPG